VAREAGRFDVGQPAEPRQEAAVEAGRALLVVALQRCERRHHGAARLEAEVGLAGARQAAQAEARRHQQNETHRDLHDHGSTAQAPALPRRRRSSFAHLLHEFGARCGEGRREAV
jgi:hypothetical protein